MIHTCATNQATHWACGLTMFQALVDELVQLLWLKGDELVMMVSKTLPLARVLCNHFELTQNTLPIVDKYAALSCNETLISLLADKVALQQYTHHTPIVDMGYIIG